MPPQFGEKPEQHPPITSNIKLSEHSFPQAGLPNYNAPRTVIFCHGSNHFKQILKETPHKQCDGYFSKLYFLNDCPEIALGDFGMGAFITSTKMQELINWGVQQFICIGTAGTLQSKAQIGDIIVCEKAIRDESASHRYLPSTKYIHAPRRMTNKLLNALKKADVPCLIGSTWTIDNFSQQTAEEISLYQKEGILTVDMEAAALFAVAHFYQVDLGVLLTINSSHPNLTWESHPEDQRSAEALRTLLTIAIASAKEG